MSGKHSRRLVREELRRIIELCRAVENKGLNPFRVNVNDLIAVIRLYFPRLEDPEDLSLDAEALNQIASIIKMQSEWVKRRATSLYRDPFLIEEKLRRLSTQDLTEIFLKTWHPIVELEQVTIGSLRMAMDYWESLTPLSERWKEEEFLKVMTERTTREELVKQGFLRDEAFLSEIEKIWMELKKDAGSEGKIDYWDFIGADSYEETIERAYLTSFLVTYGYASLEIQPLEEKIFIKPNEKPFPKTSSQPVSFPISVDYERWREWRKRQRE